MKLIKSLHKKALITLVSILFNTLVFAQATFNNKYSSLENDTKSELIKLANKEIQIIENKGQIKNDKDGSAASNVLFAIPVPSGDIFITRTGLKIQHINYFKGGEYQTIRQSKYLMELKLINSNPKAKIVKGEKSNFYRNYYFNSSDFVKDVHDYKSVKFVDIYPNIDWVIYLDEGKLKYDFIVNPGGNPNDIKFLITNSDAISLTEKGDLLIESPLNIYKEASPVSFQDGKTINTKFQISNNIITFKLEEYNSKTSLRIDPELKWGSMVSSKQNDIGRSSLLDISENKNNGDIKVVGFNEVDALSSVTTLTNSPTPSSTAPNTYILHLDSGRSPKWALYFPGTSTETTIATNCELNSKNELIIAGLTNKTGLSIGTSVYQNSYKDSFDFFISNIDSLGSINWLTYYGGNGIENFPSLCYLTQNGSILKVSDFSYNYEFLKINSNDDIVFFGQTNSNSNMTSSSNSILNYRGLKDENVLAKFKSSDGSLMWGTYIYGNNNGNYSSSTYERQSQLLIDKSDNIYILGETKSDSITFNADNNNFSSISLIVMKVDNNGNYNWGKFLNPGKDKFMYVNGATFSIDEKLLIVGSTNNDTFNVTVRREGAGSGKGYDGYLMQLDTTLNIEWYTFQWADDFDKMWKVAQKPSGVILTTNLFYKGNFMKACFDNTSKHQNNSGRDFKTAVMEFSANGMWLNTITYSGGTNDNNANNRLIYSNYYDGFYSSGYVKGPNDSFLTPTAFDTVSNNSFTVANLMFFKTRYDNLLENTHSNNEIVCYNQKLILKPSSTKSPYTADKDLVNSWSPSGLFDQNSTNNDSAVTINFKSDTVVIYKVEDACIWDTVHIQIKVLPNYLDSFVSSICSGDSVQFKDGTVFKNIQSDTSYSINFNSTDGCDSIEYYAIKVKPFSHDSDYISICIGSSYKFPDQTEFLNIDRDTFHQSNFTNQFGCDSSITTFVKVKFTIGDTITQTACTEYTWNDSTYQNKGIHEQVLTGYDGCDSFAYLDLKLNQFDTTYYASSCSDYQWEGLTYDSTGIYKLEYKTYLGCDSTLNLNLTIGAYFDTADATSCFKYVWNNKVLEKSGTYSDTFKSILGCDSITTLNLLINNVDTSVDITQNSIASNSPNSSYQWLDCSNSFMAIAGEISQRYYPTEDGDYAVDIISEEGCRDTSSCIFLDIKTHSELSINSLNNKSRLYPNPTKGHLKLDLNQHKENVQIVVYNSLGQTINQYTLGDGSEFQFNLNESKGVYLISIRTKNENLGNHFITIR